jgi:hypothetical protein
MNPSCLVPVPTVTVGLFAVVLALGSVVVASSATAAATAADRELRLTVYNDNLALVSDTRTIQVQAGQSNVELADVPAQIDPTSVHLKGLGSPLEVLEQNFQYDLASPDRILQRYLDQPVDAALKGGELKSGALLSFDGGSLVLRRPDGGVSLVTRAEVADLRLPTLPEGLRTRPTLVWLLQAEKGGATPVELSYLTGGLSWHAEYVAVADEKDTSMDLSAWVSLENSSGATYPEANLQLIAGDVQRVQAPLPMMKSRGGREVMMAMADASQGFAEETFFEYHLYTLDRPTTIADRETKQVSLFPVASTPVKKIYEYNGQRDAKKVRIILEAENKKELGMGMPLPAGKVRESKKDSRGDLQIVGEDQIDHTPKNEKLRLGVGKAFDIVAERVELSQDRITDRVFDRTIQVKLRNRKTEAVEVVVQESVWGDWEIRDASLPFVKKDARTAEFRVAVAADTEAILTFTVRQTS